MSITLKALVITTAILIMISCNRTEPLPADRPSTPADSKESLIKANQHVVRTEHEQIDDFLARYGWNMIQTQTGLRYMIYDDVKGKSIEEDDKVVLKYTVKLLNGDIVYSSDKDGLLEFAVGKGQTVTGLEEGILFLSRGDKARFIIPSYLAYGLVGDGNKITDKATLVYEVEVSEVIDL